jgi:hypothetical protein
MAGMFSFQFHTCDDTKCKIESYSVVFRACNTQTALHRITVWGKHFVASAASKKSKSNKVPIANPTAFKYYYT